MSEPQTSTRATTTSVAGTADDRVGLRIENLHKVFGTKTEVRAVDGVDLEVGQGELLVLLGPSGCGKTTLLRCIAGLEVPTEGSITIGDRQVVEQGTKLFVPTNKRAIGFMFQNYSLWPHMTVRENVTYPLRAKKLSHMIDEGRIEEVLQLVNCDHLMDRLPSQLSGGQQQRIALARALVHKPELMLFDEPLSNLDALLRTQLRSEMRRMHRERGFTGVFVTHDQGEAMELGSRIAVMRAGRIEQIGPPSEIYRSPASEYVAAFLGASNRVLVRRANGAWMSDMGSVPQALVSRLSGFGDRAALRLRPTDVRLLPDNDGESDGQHMFVSVPGTIVDVAFRGTQTDYVWKADGLEVVCGPGREERGLRIGDRARVAINHEDILVYPDDPDQAEPISMEGDIV